MPEDWRKYSGHPNYGINEQAICANCGHKYLLHMSNFKTECDACDTPEVPLSKRCPEFRGEKNESTTQITDKNKNNKR